MPRCQDHGEARDRRDRRLGLGLQALLPLPCAIAAMRAESRGAATASRCSVSDRGRSAGPCHRYKQQSTFYYEYLQLPCLGNRTRICALIPQKTLRAPWPVATGLGAGARKRRAARRLSSVPTLVGIVRRSSLGPQHPARRMPEAPLWDLPS